MKSEICYPMKLKKETIITVKETITENKGILVCKWKQINNTNHTNAIVKCANHWVKENGIRLEVLDVNGHMWAYFNPNEKQKAKREATNKSKTYNLADVYNALNK